MYIIYIKNLQVTFNKTSIKAFLIQHSRCQVDPFLVLAKANSSIFFFFIHKFFLLISILGQILSIIFNYQSCSFIKGHSLLLPQLHVRISITPCNTFGILFLIHFIKHHNLLEYHVIILEKDSNRLWISVLFNERSTFRCCN